MPSEIRLYMLKRDKGTRNEGRPMLKRVAILLSIISHAFCLRGSNEIEFYPLLAFRESQTSLKMGMTAPPVLLEIALKKATPFSVSVEDSLLMSRKSFSMQHN